MLAETPPYATALSALDRLHRSKNEELKAVGRDESRLAVGATGQRSEGRIGKERRSAVLRRRGVVVWPAFLNHSEAEETRRQVIGAMRWCQVSSCGRAFTMGISAIASIHPERFGAILRFQRNTRLRAMAAAHYSQPSVDTVHIRTLAEATSADTCAERWHVDKVNSACTLPGTFKALLYLDDVYSSSGPFEINASDAPHTVAGPAGTATLYNSSRMHRNLQPTGRGRVSLLNYYYVARPELEQDSQSPGQSPWRSPGHSPGHSSSGQPLMSAAQADRLRRFRANEPNMPATCGTDVKSITQLLEATDKENDLHQKQAWLAGNRSCPLATATRTTSSALEPRKKILLVTLVTPNLDTLTGTNIAVLRRYCRTHRHKLWMARRNFTASLGLHTNWAKVEAIRRVLAIRPAIAAFVLYVDVDSMPSVHLAVPLTRRFAHYLATA
jgi:hypothetical protein